MGSLNQEDRADAVDLAAAGVVAGDIIKTDVDATHIAERGLWCPNPLPCIGRPAVLAVIPIRVERTGDTIGELRVVRCPQCGSSARAEQRT